MKHYWTKREYELLARSSSLEETAQVATFVLSRMSRTNREIVQICGPMSTGGLGNFTDNMARFQLAIDRALAKGLLVFDQIPFQQVFIRVCEHKEDSGQYNWEILEVFYRKIFESGHVRRTLFLPGWEGSVGSKWERQLVTELGLIVEEYPAEWLE